MFDFAWSEFALIGIVALVAIGPKDLPVAIKTIAELVKKARRMAGEFQTHVDEMVREANLHEVRDQFNDLRRMDIKGKILEAVDGDQTIRKAIRENPLDAKPAPPPVPVHDSVAGTEAYTPALAGNGLGVPGLTETTVAVRPEHAIGVLAEPEAVTEETEAAAARDEAAALAFLPPAVVAAGLPSKRPAPPAFVPPGVVAQSKGRAAYASPYA